MPELTAAASVSVTTSPSMATASPVASATWDPSTFTVKALPAGSESGSISLLKRTVSDVPISPAFDTVGGPPSAPWMAISMDSLSGSRHGKVRAPRCL